jgi:hypothetical protein
MKKYLLLLILVTNVYGLGMYYYNDSEYIYCNIDDTDNLSGNFSVDNWIYLNDTILNDANYNVSVLYNFSIPTELNLFNCTDYFTCNMSITDLNISEVLYSYHITKYFNCSTTTITTSTTMGTTTTSVLIGDYHNLMNPESGNEIQNIESEKSDEEQIAAGRSSEYIISLIGIFPFIMMLIFIYSLKNRQGA